MKAGTRTITDEITPFPLVGMVGIAILLYGGSEALAHDVDWDVTVGSPAYYVPPPPDYWPPPPGFSGPPVYFLPAPVYPIAPPLIAPRLQYGPPVFAEAPEWREPRWREHEWRTTPLARGTTRPRMARPPLNETGAVLERDTIKKTSRSRLLLCEVPLRSHNAMTNSNGTGGTSRFSNLILDSRPMQVVPCCASL